MLTAFLHKDDSCGGPFIRQYKKNPKVKFSQVNRQIFNKTIKCWFYFAVQYGVCYISYK